MIRALDTYQICGLTHNVNFLRDVLTNPRFIAGRLSTAFIKARRKQRLIRLTWSELHLAPCIHCLQEEFPEGYKGHQLTPVESQQVNTHTHPLSLSKTKKKKNHNTLSVFTHIQLACFAALLATFRQGIAYTIGGKLEDTWEKHVKKYTKATPVFPRVAVGILQAEQHRRQPIRIFTARSTTSSRSARRSGV